MKPPSCQCFRPVRNSGRPRRRAFSLLELLVSFAVFIVLLGLVTAIMSSASESTGQKDMYQPFNSETTGPTTAAATAAPIPPHTSGRM